MGKKSILYLSSVLPEARGIKWIKTFEDLGYDVKCVVNRYKNNSTWGDLKGVFPLNLGSLEEKNPFSRSFLNKTIQYIEKIDFIPSVIFVRDIFQGIVGLKLKKKYNVPLIIDIADNFPEVVKLMASNNLISIVLENIFNYVENKLVREADLVITVTKSSGQYIASKHNVDLDKFCIVRNIPNIVIKNRSEVEIELTEKSIVYIGTYTPKIRDLETVVRAVHELRNNGEDLFFDIYTFNKEEVKKLVSQSDSYVRIFDPVDNNKLNEILARSYIGVIPHFRSPATDYTEPNKLYDYVVSGIPVLASDNPALVHTIKEYGFGEIYKATSVKDFINSYYRISKNRNFYVSKCIEATNQLGWSNEVKEVINFIEKST